MCWIHRVVEIDPVDLDLVGPVLFDPVQMETGLAGFDPAVPVQIDLELIGPVVPDLVDSDPVGLAQMEIVQMEIVPEPDLGPVDLYLADFDPESLRHYRGGLVVDLAQNLHWGFHQCPFLILSLFLTQLGLFRRHSRFEVEVL